MKLHPHQEGSDCQQMFSDNILKDGPTMVDIGKEWKKKSPHMTKVLYDLDQTLGSDFSLIKKQICRPKSIVALLLLPDLVNEESSDFIQEFSVS